jgi:N-glycosidase YbiA
MERILFYYEYEEHGYLSNYYASPFTADGREWPTAEHRYQARKTLDQDYAERIRLAPTADEAKKLGNDAACPVRADWPAYKVEAMRKTLAEKFRAHPELRASLLATGDAELAENSRKDFFWGIGADGSGRNMLGTLLMELRGAIRSPEGPA